jgi:hypothetical protein
MPALYFAFLAAAPGRRLDRGLARVPPSAAISRKREPPRAG